jgi:hypothetical protein
VSRTHAVVVRALLGLFVVLAVGAAYSALWLDGASQLPLQAVVVVSAVVLGVEPWVRPDRIRVSMAGGVVLVVAGAYGAFVAFRGGQPLSDPVVAVPFVVGALLVVVTRRERRSAVQANQ